MVNEWENGRDFAWKQILGKHLSEVEEVLLHRDCVVSLTLALTEYLPRLTTTMTTKKQKQKQMQGLLPHCALHVDLERCLVHDVLCWHSDLDFVTWRSSLYFHDCWHEN